MIKTLNKIEIEGNYLNTLKAHTNNSQLISYSMVKD